MGDDGAPAAGRAGPQEQLARLVDGYLTTQLLFVAATLGLAEALADGPLPPAALADAVGADPARLVRVLRGLAAEGVLDEEADGTFALTAMGAWLRDGIPGSLKRTAMLRGGLYFTAAPGLLAAVQDGGTPYERVHGEDFFSHLARDPDREAAFQAAMASRAALEAEEVVAVYDFTGVRRLVDVGGGEGVTLARILTAAPSMEAVLLDRPGVVPRAEARLAAAGLAGRCTCVAGDFLAAVPPGADAYLLSRIIHDWGDADARRILAAVRAAMPPRARLVLIDLILPERARDQPAAIRMDLHMLLLFGARERTVVEFEALLAAEGLALRRVVSTTGTTGLGVLEATRA